MIFLYPDSAATTTIDIQSDSGACSPQSGSNIPASNLVNTYFCADPWNNFITITGGWEEDLELDLVIILTSGVCGDVTVRAEFDDPSFASQITHEYRDYLITNEQTINIPAITVYPTCYPADISLSTIDYSQGASDPRIDLDLSDPTNPLFIIDNYSSGFEGTINFDLIIVTTDAFNTEHRLSIDITFTDKCSGNTLLNFYDSWPVGAFSITYI